MVENWKNEKEELENAEQMEYWKPEEGEHHIKFLSDGIERNFEWEGQTILKVDFDVEVEGNKCIWSVTKGRTTSSLYGQIVTIGAHKNTLVGETITLFVKGVKMNRQYFIKEASEINKLNKVKTERVSEEA